ncbi:nuclear transport factor 2 family protein [Sphingosinicella sp. BN140058]|uniref:nuclear transport factor 2 family protein n=1 Tax=Sphingosinicella sp. BN140058 TaxID=1892855 RepID=UPI0013EBC984|nr:nuclear transport factor 2 family protein [Sphingosinicella sp. BN140058]
MMIATLALAVAVTAASGQPDPAVHVPPEIGAAYGRLGKAIASHDVEGVKSVWAEDFVVNAPNNEVLHRDQVIAAIEGDFLNYKDFQKHIRFVGEKPEITIVMGYDTMVPLNGPGAGQHVKRPFTDIWAKRAGTWMLIARQATIAAVD